MWSAAWRVPNRRWNSKSNKTCHLARFQDQMQYLLRSTKQEELQLQRRWQLFQIMRRKEAIPQEFKDASIIHLFKRKGNPQLCDKHRGISLLSIVGKVLARILLNRLNEHLEQSELLPESQCGFRKDTGTIDMIFTARQLQEKCQEQNMDLYMTFVDLTKAFDIVIPECLWKHHENTPI